MLLKNDKGLVAGAEIPGEASLARLGGVSSHSWALVRQPKRRGLTAPSTAGSAGPTASPLGLKLPTIGAVDGTAAQLSPLQRGTRQLGLGWLPSHTPHPRSFLFILCFFLT